MNAESTTPPRTNGPRGTAGILAGLLAAMIVTMLGLAARADAGTPPSATTGNSLSRAETLASPSVVLIEYELSATAQNIRTGQVFTSLTSNGPITTSYVGTGFFVSSNGFIVTAAHLAAPTADDQKRDILTELYAEALATNNCAGCGADPAQDAASAVANYQLTGVRAQITVFTQDLDLAGHPTGLTAALIQSSPVTENDTAVIKVQGSNYPVLPIGDSDAAKVGDPIAVIGYPSTAIDNVDLSTLTSPTVTSGSVTNKPSQGGFARLQSDATVEHGNSGGPMINAAGEVIGIVSNGPTSTTNFFIPSNAVKVVQHEAGVDNSPGPIDGLWRQGMSAYSSQQYRQAEQNFAQCVALNKVQVGCAAYEKLAVGNVSSDTPAAASFGGGANNSVLVVIGIGVLAGLAVGLALVRRGRRGRRAATTPTYPQYPAPPVYPAPPAYSQQPVHQEQPVYQAPTYSGQTWS